MVIITLVTTNQKMPDVRNFSACNSGQEMAVPIYGRLGFVGSFGRRTSRPVKYLVLGGSIWFFLFAGGGSANLISWARGFFLKNVSVTLLILKQFKSVRKFLERESETQEEGAREVHYTFYQGAWV